MSCETCREDLTALWSDELSDERRAEVESRIESCSECDAEARDLAALWKQLGSLDRAAQPEVPSAALRSRFYSSLDEAQRNAERPPLWRSIASLNWLRSSAGTPTPRWSFAALAMGVALGASLMWAVGANREIQRLSLEVAAIQGTAGLSLLEHPSASERLRAVSWSSHSLADDRIVEALLASVRQDSNVNVRLAAIETLARRIDSPRIRAGLVEALGQQDSPVLQVALAEILQVHTENGGGGALEELLERQDLEEAVREQIQQLLKSV